MVNSCIKDYMLMPLEEGHFKELYNWNMSEEHFEMYTCRPIGIKRTYEEYKNIMHQSMNNRNERTYVLIYIDNERLPLGRIKLFDYNARNHSAEFGYYLPRTNRSRGLGSVMLKKFLNISFKDTKLDLNKLYATTSSNNIASNKLLMKSGFTIDGRMREHYWINGKKYDQCIYSILRSELA